jgi:hypothetical protein
MPHGKAANHTSDQARDREGHGLHWRRIAIAPSRFFNVPSNGQLKNREEFVLDRTDIQVDKTQTSPRHNCEEPSSFINSRTIVKAKKVNYKCYLKKMRK